MPLYAQQCRSCGERFEIITRDFAALRPCPHCASLDTEQLVTAPNFRMGAGRGFSIKRGPAHNPYENLTLQHVRDEGGRPITVHSERELHEAEKRHNFVHAASWGLENAPPQHEPWAGDVAHGYTRKWNHDPAAYGPEAVARAAAESGMAQSADDTLVNLPNSTREV